ncbi:MAG: hemolysin family protein [Rickettsiales bacterium]
MTLAKPKKKKLYTKIFDAIKSVIPKTTFEESISEVIKDHHMDKSVHQEEKNVLENILVFGDLEAADIMVPRAEIVAISHKSKYETLQKLFIEHGYSRIPVYKDKIEDIIGFIHIKELFKSGASKFSTAANMRSILHIPRTMKISDLLTRMKTLKTHIAIVIDEHGCTDGLVTIEDIIEEIVGDITDEHELEKSKNYISHKEGAWVCDARVHVEDLEKELDMNISEDESEYDTLAGLIISLIGRIPQKGDKIEHPKGLLFVILDANMRRIKTVRVEKVRS